MSYDSMTLTLTRTSLHNILNSSHNFINSYKITHKVFFCQTNAIGKTIQLSTTFVFSTKANSVPINTSFYFKFGARKKEKSEGKVQPFLFISSLFQLKFNTISSPFADFVVFSLNFKEMSSSTSIESFEGSLPNDGEECLNIVNSTIDLDANTNEGAFTNEVTPANEVGNEENVENNDIVIQKAKRKKTSLVWEHFKEVELKNGTKKWQYRICHILDPRIKMMGVNMCFPLIYPGDEAKKNIEYVRNALNEMYKEYVDLLNERDEEGSSRTSVDQNGLILKPKKSSGWEMLMDYVDEQQAIPAVKSEVEDYLSEPTYRPNDNGHMSFCALEWWKLNSGKYRVLSQMAADVLAIPISTVASESTFSAGGRVIDPFRASLDSSTVQTLICGGDWLRVMHGIKKKPKVKQVPIEIELLLR
ncbi:zinc finger BED domain-containing protein DAYSLEEPER [Trifolium repens]|nr:zinc finger BED domain-containing protein DAYSLEEPER [Trifolium repens]